MNTSSNFLDVIYHEYTYFPPADPRTDGWPLLDSPGTVTAILILYFYLVWKGPKWMEHRKAFDMPRLLFWYNVVLVILSFVICFESALVAIQDNYTLVGCQPVTLDHSPLAIRMKNMTWWYFFSKIVELMDTMFFVLRKKNNLITFLHVYHHGTMPIPTWFSAKYVAGGAKVVPMALNSGVHVVMYTYYALCTFGPQMQKYLWWKKYITRLQILQFTMVISHAAWGMTIRPCSFPKIVHLFVVVYTLFFLGLFINFYIKQYKMKKKVRTD